MKILVIDGQGGGIGKSLIEQIRKAIIEVEIIAVGTNSLATSQMLKAGADVGATGENAVVYNCQLVDMILGPMGICYANAMHGEISPKMAEAITSSQAKKLLIPMSKCNVTIVGIQENPLPYYIAEVVARVKEMQKNLD